MHNTLYLLPLKALQSMQPSCCLCTQVRCINVSSIHCVDDCHASSKYSKLTEASLTCMRPPELRTFM